MKQRILSFLILLFGALGIFPAVAAESASKFHLVYRVIATKVEQGAQVEVEPALITDGERLVFAYDYCRHHYPKENYSAGRDKHEQRAETKEVVVVDRSMLENYCQRKSFTLKGSELSVLDNTGVTLVLSDLTYNPEPFVASQQWAPEHFNAVIVRVNGKMAEKLPAAKEVKQPYVFLMSRNRALLERVVPVTKVDSTHAASLFARHENYMKERMTLRADTNAKEECLARLGRPPKDYPEWHEWIVRSSEPPVTAELLYVDVDGDGGTDLIARLIEDPKRIAMVRIYYANEKVQCAFRNTISHIMDSPISRPISVLKTHACVYGFTQFSVSSGVANQTLVPLLGSLKSCFVKTSLRWHEQL